METVPGLIEINPIMRRLWLPGRNPVGIDLRDLYTDHAQEPRGDPLLMHFDDRGRGTWRKQHVLDG